MNIEELKVGNIYWFASYLDGAQKVRYEGEGEDGLLVFSKITGNKKLFSRDVLLEHDVFKTEIGAALAAVAMVDPFDSKPLNKNLERLRHVAENMPHFRAVFYANQIDEYPR